nr:tyrosine-type recombinase/integrase [Microbacterium sp. Leaf436]
MDNRSVPREGRCRCTWEHLRGGCARFPVGGSLDRRIPHNAARGVDLPRKGKKAHQYPRASGGSRSWFVTALDAAGLERMTVHDLRHTAASLAISSGANVKAVQRMLGHASAAMTLDVYADLFDDDVDTVSAALDAARSRVVVAK